MPETDKGTKFSHFSDDEGKCACYVNYVFNLLPITEAVSSDVEEWCEQSYADVKDWGINHAVRKRATADEERGFKRKLKQATKSL